MLSRRRPPPHFAPWSVSLFDVLTIPPIAIGRRIGRGRGKPEPSVASNASIITGILAPVVWVRSACGPERTVTIVKISHSATAAVSSAVVVDRGVADGCRQRRGWCFCRGTTRGGDYRTTLCSVLASRCRVAAACPGVACFRANSRSCCIPLARGLMPLPGFRGSTLHCVHGTKEDAWRLDTWNGAETDTVQESHPTFSQKNGPEGSGQCFDKV